MNKEEMLAVRKAAFFAGFQTGRQLAMAAKLHRAHLEAFSAPAAPFRIKATILWAKDGDVPFDLMNEYIDYELLKSINEILYGRNGIATAKLTMRPMRARTGRAA